MLICGQQRKLWDAGIGICPESGFLGPGSVCGQKWPLPWLSPGQVWTGTGSLECSHEANLVLCPKAAGNAALLMATAKNLWFQVLFYVIRMLACKH